jgi:hypothetical protein
MKKILLALLWFVSSAALAQSYPSPTYKNVTITGGITGGTITGLSAPIPFASGGTNASTATGATNQLQYWQCCSLADEQATGFGQRTGLHGLRRDWRG